MRRLTLILLSLLYVGVQGLWAAAWTGETYTSEEGYIFRIGGDSNSSHAEIEGVTTDFINSLWTNYVFDENGTENTNWQEGNTATVTTLNIPTTLKISGGEGTEYTVVSLDNGAFEEAFPSGDNTYWKYHYFDGIKELTIPPAVYSIGSYMFDGWQSLETVTIYSDEISIWDCAFANCTSLTTVYMYGKTVSLHGYTFAEDVALRNFYLTNVETLTVDDPDNVFSCKNNTVTGENGETIENNAVAGCTIYLPEAFVYELKEGETDTGNVSATIHKYGNIVQGGTKTNTTTEETTTDNSYVESLLSNGYKISGVTLKYDNIVPNEGGGDELTATVDKETNTVTVNYDIEGGVQLKATVTLQLYYGGTEVDGYTFTESVDETYTNILNWDITTSSDYGETTGYSDVTIENLLVTNSHKVSEALAPITATITVSTKDEEPDVTATCTVDFADYVSTITLPGSVVVLVGTSEPVEVHIELKYAGLLSSTESITFTYDNTTYGTYATVNVDEETGAVYVTGISIPTYSTSSNGNSGGGGGGGGGGGASTETDSAVPVFYVSYGTEEKHEVYIYVNDITDVKFYEPSTDGNTASTTEARSITLDLNTDDTVKKLFSDFTWYDTAQFHSPPSGATTTSNWLLYFAEGTADEGTDGEVETVTVDEQNGNEIDIYAGTVTGKGRVIAIPKNKVKTNDDGTTSLPDDFDTADPTIPYAACEVNVIKTTLSIKPESTTVVINSTGNAMPAVTISPTEYTSFNQNDIVWTITKDGADVTTDFTISAGTFTASSTPGTYTFTASIADNDKIEPVSCTVTVVTIASITLSNTEINLITNEEGSSATLTATIVWWDGTTDVNYQNDNYVTWSVTQNSEFVKFCSSTGTITAVANGTATITATSTLDPYVTATCTINVTTNYITSIKFNATDSKYLLNYEEGQTLLLFDEITATWAVTKTENDVPSYTVSLGNGSQDIVKIDADGTVTPLKAGTVTVIVTEANGATAECTITVKAIKGIGINYSQLTFVLSENDNYTGTLYVTEIDWDYDTNETFSADSNQPDKVIWYSRDSEIATVDNDGNVTAVGAGITTIVAKYVYKKSDGTYGNAFYATCTVTVKVDNYVTNIAFANANYVLNLEDADPSIALPEIVVTWADQENPGDITPTITFDPEGIITIEDGAIVPTADYKTGEVKVTATYTESATGETFTTTCTVNVVVIDELSIDSTIDYLIVGEATDLPAVTAHWSTGETVDVTTAVQWDIVNGEIVNGQIVASRGGTVVISATYYFTENGRKHIAQISIRALVDPVEGTAIELSPTYLTMTVGETANLTVIFWSDGATALTFEWSSDNTSVATVEAQSEFISDMGVVTAVGVGTATITVRYGNLSATCAVTVTADSSSGDDGKVDLEGDDDTPHPTPLPDDGDDSNNPDDPNNSDNNDETNNSDDDATNRDGTIVNPDEDRDTDNESSQDPEEDEDADYNRNKGEVYEYMRFNLAGQRIEGPQRGINIIKYSDGSKQKVLVK